MLLGLGGVPLQASPALTAIDATASGQAFRLVREEARDLVAKLPSMFEYSAHLHGQASRREYSQVP
jgi:tryptophan halogenase